MRSVKKTGWIRMAALAAGLGLAAAAPGAARAENLADALIGAYNTSGLLEQNRALLRAADEDVALTVAALRPVINWTLSFSGSTNQSRTGGFVRNTDVNTMFTGLQIDQLIWDGGAARLNTQAAKEAVLSARQQLINIEQQVLLRGVSAYLSVLLQEENVSLRENNLRVLGEEQRAAQDRFDVGEVTRTDVALAEARVAQARSGLAAARGELANAKAEYLTAVGRSPGTLAGQPSLPQPPASIEAAHALALRNHPLILAAQHQVSAAELAVLRSGKAYGPTVVLRGEFGLAENLDNSNYSQDSSLALTMRQSIYQGGALAASHRRSMATRDASRSNLLTVQKNVRQTVTNAFSRLLVARASLAATQEQVRASQVAFDGIREEATLGARTTLDVLTAEQDLLDALTLRISAQAEQSFAAFELLAAQGLLTAEQLGLAVQIYDPTIYYNLVKGAPSPVISKRGRDLDRVLEAIGKK
jgi:outer membrane protein